MCYKNCLHNGIMSIDKTSENMIWLKIIKEYLNTDKNLVIGGIYNSPINSSYTKSNDMDIFDKIQDKILTFSQNEYVIFWGDLNARVGDLQDFVDENESDVELLNVPQDYQVDRYRKLRNN